MHVYENHSGGHILFQTRGYVYGHCRHVQEWGSVLYCKHDSVLLLCTSKYYVLWKSNSSYINKSLMAVGPKVFQ